MRWGDNVARLFACRFKHALREVIARDECNGTEVKKPLAPVLSSHSVLFLGCVSRRVPQVGSVTCNGVGGYGEG